MTCRVFPTASVIALLFAGALWPATPLLIKRSQPSSAADTLKALDSNGDGIVSLAEVKAFATGQGLSAAEAEDEFKGMDANGDGHLDAREIAVSLNDQGAAPLPEAVAQGPAPTREQDTAVVAAAEQHAALPVAVSVSGAASTSESSATTQNAESVQLERAAQQVKIRASRIVAQELAKLIEGVTDAYQKDSQQAEDLDKKAKVFRAEATELAQAARAQVEEAATSAVEPTVKKAMASLSKSEQEARDAEHEAERLRGEAKVYLEKALEAQAHVASGVQEVLGASSARQGQ